MNKEEESILIAKYNSKAETTESMLLNNVVNNEDLLVVSNKKLAESFKLHLLYFIEYAEAHPEKEYGNSLRARLLYNFDMLTTDIKAPDQLFFDLTVLTHEAYSYLSSFDSDAWWMCEDFAMAWDYWKTVPNPITNGYANRIKEEE